MSNRIRIFRMVNIPLSLSVGGARASGESGGASDTQNTIEYNPGAGKAISGSIGGIAGTVVYSHTLPSVHIPVFGGFGPS